MSPALPAHSGATGDDDVDSLPDELGHNIGVAVFASVRPTIFYRNGAALDPPEFAQPLDKRGGIGAPRCSRGGTEKADGRQLARLLRTRYERPSNGRAAEHRDELTSSHGLPRSEVGNLPNSPTNCLALMSQMGQSLPKCDVRSESSLPSIGDARSMRRHGRNVPTTEVGSRSLRIEYPANKNPGAMSRGFIVSERVADDQAATA